MSEVAKILARGLGEEAAKAAVDYLIARRRKLGSVTLDEILTKTLDEMDRQQLRRAIITARAEWRAKHP